MANAAITGTGWYVPPAIISNSFFEDGSPWFFYDGAGKRIPDATTRSGYREALLTDEKIRNSVSGISERRKSAPDEYVHHLITKAAGGALERARLAPEDLDGIIVATVTAQTRYPSAANRVQELLGARNVKTSFDLANACAGFPLALNIARYSVASAGERFLVAGAETLTKIADYEGRDISANLFGDGAGVAILAPTNEERGILAYAGRSEQAGGRLGYISEDPRGLLRMPNGPEVFRNATRSMHEVTRELLENVGWGKDDVDLYVFHQANQRITDKLLSTLGVDSSRVGNNIAHYGNMSAATNPVLLAQAVESGRVGPGSRVIIVSFGAGLVTAGVAVRL